EKEYHTLSAEIQDTGDLLLSGYDCGPSVKEYFGDYDHEYWLTVKFEFVPKILLNLIKERFKNDLEFKDWLNEKKIPYDFKTY
ncbi:MAG: hypothetical protein ACFFAN_17675, partial [Promethearchaeota archaeon]